MKPKSKSCDFCARRADCSLVLVISTLGVSPRIQQCSQSISLCKRCIQQFCESDVAQITAQQREALRTAYTAIERAFIDRAHDTPESKD